jgi:glycosyltransferase involved in cell wall biosynthesis
MRALHFGRFYSDSFGGLERHVDLLIRSMARWVESDNLVASAGFSGSMLNLGYCRVIRAPSLGLLASVSLCPTMPIAARLLHAQMSYDIIHLHFPDPMSHLAWKFIPRGPKLVISWHSDVIRQQRMMRFYRPFLERIVNAADAVVVATPAHISSSRQLGLVHDRSKLRIVPYGLDFAPFRTSPELEAQVQAIRSRLGAKHVLFALGRHVYYKGFRHLIRAMGGIPDAVLVLGGAGPLLEEHRRLVRNLSLEDRVVFPGRIREASLPAYYHACDVFCMPSTHPSEAFGLVQLEAMACARPVVCCSLGNGVNYVHQDGVNGLAVPPGDPAALAQAVNALLADPERRRRMGEAGQVRAYAEYNIERMAAGMLSVYRSIL